MVIRKLVQKQGRRFFATFRNPYENLGVSKDASVSDIKRAYFELAKKYHPDTNRDPSASKKFLEIQKAYEILSDPEKKKNFDNFGSADENVHEGFHSSYSSRTGGFDPSDLFSRHFTGFSNSSFADMFGFTDFGKEALSLNIEIPCSLTFAEAVLGCRKTVSYSRTNDCNSCSGSGVSPGSKLQSCKNCHGTGQEMRSRGGFVLYTTCRTCNGQGSINPNPCSACSSRGYMNTTNSIELDIPSGVSNDVIMKVSGAGNVRASKKGDLLVQFKVSLHEVFERKKLDIFSKHDIDMFTAMLGGEVEVPTIHGNVLVKVPPGTQPGDIKRLLGKGIPKKSGEKGNHYVTFVVRLPKFLTTEQRTTLEKLRESCIRDSESRENSTI